MFCVHVFNQVKLRKIAFFIGQKWPNIGKFIWFNLIMLKNTDLLYLK